MRAGTASQHERLLRLFRRNADKAAAAGVTGLRFSGVGDGSTIEVGGRQLVNFSHCSYLGLASDPRLKVGAITAIERFGPHYSASQTYAGVDLYVELERLLSEMTAAPAVVLPPTTTLGHLACLPTLVGDGDAVVLDSQSHASLQLAMQVLAGRGIEIRPVNHNDLHALSGAVADLSTHKKVWYVADGVYSMLGDLAHLDDVARLMELHPNMNCYLDDAHGFSWMGEHGRGFVLSGLPLSERTVVAVGLGKSFGSGGAALLFGNPDWADQVRHVGGPMSFSGPVQPPILGANVESARIHLSPEHDEMRSRIDGQITLVSSLLAEHGLPVASWAHTPIWFVRVGEMDRMLEVARRMRDRGFLVSPSGFPAVPFGLAGIRFTHSLNHSEDQIGAMVECLKHEMMAVVGDLEPLVDLTEIEQSDGSVETFLPIAD